MYFCGNPTPCDYISVEDSLMLLTPELREVAKQIMPCAEEINPENSRQQGAFRECATATYKRVETGPASFTGRRQIARRLGVCRLRPVLRVDMGGRREVGRV